ncbi:hypothetical protein [Mycobacterium sp.]|uniref:hypothetical protein n=1 Tax=Mycobacterium sp. TaxID=1785 RepID=UPI0031DA9923
MDRKLFERKDKLLFEKYNYIVIRALPSIIKVGSKFITHRSDFLNGFDLIAISETDNIYFIQTTSSNTILEKDLKRSFYSHRKKLDKLFKNFNHNIILSWYYKEKNRWKHIMYMKSPITNYEWKECIFKENGDIIIK